MDTKSKIMIVVLAVVAVCGAIIGGIAGAIVGWLLMELDIASGVWPIIMGVCAGLVGVPILAATQIQRLLK